MSLKIYLIYDVATQAMMTIQEAYDARWKFELYARSQAGKLFSFDLYAGEIGNPGHLYRAGAIFDSMDELKGLPRSDEIDRFLGLGPGIDLSQLPADQVDRETFFFKPNPE
jgi:hypothetical protein